MARIYLGSNVFERALARIIYLYKNGDVAVSFSGGKDSTCCLELTRLAAKKLGIKKVTVIMNDEEICYPGTYEYAERIANEKDIDFHWCYMNNPNVNPFNREQPYWWAFDPLVPEDMWVRKYPPFAKKITRTADLYDLCTLDQLPHFPTRNGVDLYDIIGIRVQESPKRAMALASMQGSFITARDYPPEKNYREVRNAWPIYDWRDGDVWKAIRDNGWDYNSAYDVMFKMGVSASEMRIAPITLNPAAIKQLAIASRAWPHWFDRVANRIPGIRTAAKFGIQTCTPQRRLNETWEECFHRTCIEEAPLWVAERARKAKEMVLRRHAKHSTAPFPDVAECVQCGLVGSWKELANKAWDGDPFNLYLGLGYVEPGFFRKGAGVFKVEKPILHAAPYTYWWYTPEDRKRYFPDGEVRDSEVENSEVTV